MMYARVPWEVQDNMLDAYEYADMFTESRNGSYLKEQTWGSIGDPYGQRDSNAYNNVDPLITSYLLDKTAQYHISCALAELRKLL